MATEEGKVLISVSEELAEHFAVTKRLRDEAVEDQESTYSQKAAVITATTAIIRDLAKIQTELFNSTTIALLTQEIINGLSEASFELKQKVVQALQEKLENFN